LSVEEVSEYLLQVAETPRIQSPIESGERIMKRCHATTAGSIASCDVLKRRYAPGHFEIDEYCKTNEHRKSPLYLRGIISLDQAENHSTSVHF
jgi:hypothetical protein